MKLYEFAPIRSVRLVFVHEVALRMPRPRIDYLRLNIRARRAGCS